MSYCRFGPNSDAYIYPSVAYGEPNNIVCCGCGLGEGWGADDYVRDAAGMLDHIKEHQAAGHVIPDHAIARLREEAAQKPSEGQP